MTLTKIDKKVLIILIVLAVIILLGFWLGYKYMTGVKVQNSAGGIQTEQKADGAVQVQVQADGLKAEGTNGGGSVSICLDKCGDNVCQETDPKCLEYTNLNCICPETLQECPQDCK